MDRFISANIHLTDSCNYRCRFCFSRSGCSSGPPLSSVEWRSRISDLVQSRGVEKINFAGGEPLLHPDLSECIRFAHDAGAVTGVMTNGSLVDDRFLESVDGELDWIGFSVDSAQEDIETMLGRGSGGHLKGVVRAVDLARSYGIRIKLNVTVTRVCLDDDFRGLIEAMHPERVKFMQVTGVPGVNDASIGLLSVTDEEFGAFRERNSGIILPNGARPVFETSSSMYNTYLMLDRAGKIRVNRQDGYRFVDYDRFWADGAESILDPEGYVRRGGVYDWS